MSEWNALFVPALGILLPAILMALFPFWQGNFFFTVRVPEGFRQTAEGRRIARGFRLAILGTALVCSVAMYAAIRAAISWLMLPAPLTNSVMMMIWLQWARRRTLPFAAAPAGAVRRASLSGDDSDAQAVWPWVVVVSGFALMATAAIFVSMHWNALPERFPMHWGIDGKADRWTTKSFTGVFGILFVGVAVQSMLCFVLYALSQTSTATSLRRRFNQMVVALASMAVSLIHSLIVLLPLRDTAAALPGPAWIWWILPVAFMAPTVFLAIRLQSAEDDELEPTRDQNWWAGVVYLDSSDSRMMVPQRLGPGFTFNLGHPVVRIVLPAFLLLFFGAVFVLPKVVF